MPVSVLTAAPYSLASGVTVVVTVEALNANGYSTPSAVNTNGATIEGVPTAAPTLASGSGTSDTQI